MEANFFPKVRGLVKQNQRGHSLLFDSSMTDKVIRQNAYEQRMLFKKTEQIDKQKQQCLEEHNFYKSQFLLRFMPVVERKNELRKEFLSKVFGGIDMSLEEPLRPLSSFPNVKSRTSTEIGKGRLSFRRIVSAQLTSFPEYSENLDDILNGYRSTKPQTKSVSPTKMRIRRNWNLESLTDDIHAGNKTLFTKKFTHEGLIRPNNIETAAILDCDMNIVDERSKGKVTKQAARFGKDCKKNFPEIASGRRDNCENIRQESLSSLNSSKETVSTKILNKGSTKTVRISSGDDSMPKRERFRYNPITKQLKIFQNKNKLPESLVEELDHSLNSATNTSKTTRLLKRMLNIDEDNNFLSPSVCPGKLRLPESGDISHGIHFLSDVKQRQRHETQRLRIMRTIVLAYDTVWNERIKKISNVT